jgi:hypothetical protein
VIVPGFRLTAVAGIEAAPRARRYRLLWAASNGAKTMTNPKPDHFHYEAIAIPIIDPAMPETATLLFRLDDGQHHFSMSRQAFQLLALEMIAELERAPLPARGSA